MELQAALHSLHLYSPDPLTAAHFYSSTYGMELAASGEGFRCRGAGRQLRLSPGPVNQLKYAQFVLQTDGAWTAFVKRVATLKHQPLPDDFVADGQSVGIEDPDGNLLVFSPPEPPSVGLGSVLPPATLQHFALRSASLPAMLAFYSEQLGFVLSDAVKGDDGTLRACFLRTDKLHHSLALFFAPSARFDHQSFEASDWAAMREWGDHMAAIRVPIVWGLGRHGPGNDVFFMVADPDGNLAEISAEIEHCESDRPAGTWPHEERTLNLWGKAIMRS